MDVEDRLWLAKYEDMSVYKTKEIVKAFYDMNKQWQDLTDQLMAENYKLRQRLEEYAIVEEWTPFSKGNNRHPWYIRSMENKIESIGWVFE